MSYSPSPDSLAARIIDHIRRGVPPAQITRARAGMTVRRVRPAVWREPRLRYPMRPYTVRQDNLRELAQQLYRMRASGEMQP